MNSSDSFTTLHSNPDNAGRSLVLHWSPPHPGPISIYSINVNAIRLATGLSSYNHTTKWIDDADGGGIRDMLTFKYGSCAELRSYESASSGARSSPPDSHGNGGPPPCTAKAPCRDGFPLTVVKFGICSARIRLLCLLRLQCVRLFALCLGLFPIVKCEKSDEFVPCSLV